MIRRSFLLILVTTVAVLPACGSDDPTGPGATVGTYSLSSVGGQPLPFVLFQNGPDKIDVTAGQLTFNATGTYLLSLTLQVTSGGSGMSEIDTESGNWAQTGDRLTLTNTIGTVSEGSRTGNSITFIIDGNEAVFTK